MAGAIQHKFVSAKADSVDGTLVRPSNWNANLNVAGGNNGDIFERASGEADGWRLIQFTGMTIWAAFAVTAGAEPAGWLLCDGRAVSRTTFARLFTVMGEVWGVGDGSTTFNLPDLRRRLPMGLLSTDPAFDAVGEVGGSLTKDLTHTHGLANHVHSMQGHTHVLQDGADQATDGAIGHVVKDPSDGTLRNFAIGTLTTLKKALFTTVGPSTTNTGAPSPNTSDSGGSATQDIMPPYAVGNWLVKT